MAPAGDTNALDSAILSGGGELGALMRTTDWTATFLGPAYTPFLGIKHPRALGRPRREVWHEIWDIVGPLLQGVVESGDATRSDDHLLLLERHGSAEECYFTFSYRPIRDESRRAYIGQRNYRKSNRGTPFAC